MWRRWHSCRFSGFSEQTEEYLLFWHILLIMFSRESVNLWLLKPSSTDMRSDYSPTQEIAEGIICAPRGAAKCSLGVHDKAVTAIGAVYCTHVTKVDFHWQAFI